MENSKEKALKFIDAMGKRIFSNHISNDLYFWNYYYSITGFIGDEYFHVYFYNSKKENKNVVEICKTTECTEEITKIIQSL